MWIFTSEANPSGGEGGTQDKILKRAQDCADNGIGNNKYTSNKANERTNESVYACILERYRYNKILMIHYYSRGVAVVLREDKGRLRC